MLLELAIGDAYGAGFEYAPQAFVEAHNDLSCYVQNPKNDICPGCYTDDTQMSLAVAEALLSNENWTSALLAEKFVQAFHRDPREGYAQGFYHFLKSVTSGQEFIQQIRPDSEKNGAAMRAAPIGVFLTIAEVKEKSRLQAALTHNTEVGISSAMAVSLMTHYCLYSLGSKAYLGQFLEEHLGGEWSKPWTGMVGTTGWMSVQAAVTAITFSRKMSELLKNCIAFTGDVDTVAAIALAAGSCSSEIEQDLPQYFFDHLENNLYGADYIRALDAQLLARVVK